jgi:DNA-directed RNA polymerase II subunit RPB9
MRIKTNSQRRLRSDSVASGKCHTNLSDSKNDIADWYHSANLLYPKEDKVNMKLEFACRTCYYSEDAETTCIYRNELSNTVGETAGITQDIGEDPTVGDDDSSDPNADFYAHAQPSSSASASTSISNLPANAMPDFCTMCGQEVL